MFLTADLKLEEKIENLKNEIASGESILVKFYKKGFFGYGEEGNFRYGSLAHFIPIILLGVAIYLLFRFRDKIRNWKHEENLRFALGFSMILIDMSYFWRLLYVGASEMDADGLPIDLLDKLPLQVCQWTCILGALMMMKKSKVFYHICFYVCLTIGIFPLLTPSVITTTGPAYYRYYQYFLEHIIPPLCVFYMTFVHKFRPTKKGIIPAVCFMSVEVIFALICNANIPRANYLYLAVGTEDGGGSIMDPIRDLVGGSTVALIALLAVLVVGIFFAAYYAHIGILKLNKMYHEKKANKPALAEGAEMAEGSEIAEASESADATEAEQSEASEPVTSDKK